MVDSRMMMRRLVPSLLLVLALLCAGGCSGRSGEGLSVTLDVVTLPPPPPAEPAIALPPPPPPPPPPPDPETIRRQRLEEVNGRLKPIYFPGDSWEITPEAAAVLESNASVLGSLATYGASVEGHADARGTDDYRRWLGLWRAKAVKDALRKLGLAPENLTLASRADSELESSGETDAERTPNRRVEIVVKSLD